MKCDICSKPAKGTIINSNDMKYAVKQGFNPYKLGIIPDIYSNLGIDTAQAWQNTIVNDTTDWNICSSCLPQLKKYLPKSVNNDTQAGPASIPQIIDQLRVMDESDVLKIDFISLVKLSAMLTGEEGFINGLISAADSSDDASLRRKIGSVLVNGFGFFGSKKALEAGNRLSKSKDKTGFFGNLFGKKNSETKPVKVETSSPKPPETIEVPNVWGIGDGEPFVILRDPNIDDLFKTVSGADFKSTVTAYLGHPDRKVRIATLNQVIVRKTGAYNQSVVDRLADADAEVRMIAAKALWTDIKAVEFAIACLRDEARGYTSFGAPTFSTMKPEQAVAGVDILRKTAPNSADLARFEEIYDELWNAEKREEEERAAFRAKQSKIEEIKKSLSSQELDELMSSMSDMERKFNIGDVLLNQKIEEKYLNKIESSLQTKEPLPEVSSQVSSPTEVKSTETSPVTKTSTKEIFCPYCNIYIIPDEVAGKRYCPNDGRELPTSIEEPKAALSLSGAPAHTETVICPFCQTAIIPQEIAGKFYCPNDGKLLTLPSSTMREERNQPTSKTYCNNCGKEISTASPHSEICPYCGSSTS